MSSKTQDAGDKESGNDSKGKVIEKTVQFVSYNTTYGDLRYWADTFYPDLGFLETETVEERDIKVFLDGEELSMKQSVKEELIGHDIGDLDIQVSVGTKDQHKVNINKFAEKVRDDVVGVMDTDVPGFSFRNFYTPKWTEDDGDGKVMIYRQTGSTFMLKPRGEREGDDIYENKMETYPVLKHRVRYEGLTEEQAETFDAVIVDAFEAGLSHHDAVEVLRLGECKREVSEEGVCTNL